MLWDIAAEHQKGRRLFVGTTNLDTQRLTVWDMGAIAAIGTPEAYKLFRRILLASAAIPVMFPPIYIEVEAGGNRYDEVHVDGGAAAQVITYEFTFRPMAVKEAVLGKETKPRPVRIFIIRNSKTKPEWGITEAGLKGITERAMSTIIKYHGIGDLYRIFALSRLDGVDFNLAEIPGDFNEKRQEEFDRKMKLKRSLPKTLVVLISLVMIGGLSTVSLWVTDAGAQRRGAAGVGGGRVGTGPSVGGAAGIGGGPVGSGPGYGGARVAATPRNYVAPGPGVPGRRGIADPRGFLDPRGPLDPRNPY